MYILNTVSERLRLNNRGSTSFRAIFWILFLAAAGYAGYMIAPPYVSYYMFKTDIEEEAKFAHMYKDEKLIARIMAKAESWGVPVVTDDINISRTATDVRVTAQYSVTLNFPGMEPMVIHYYIDVTKPLTDASGALH